MLGGSQRGGPRPLLRQRTLPHPGARAVSLAERRPLMRHHEFMAVKGVGIEFFLESRIGEDEARARAVFDRDGAADSRVALTPNDRVSMTGWRMLAECVLKRDMLFVHHDVPQEGSGRARVDIVCATCEETYRMPATANSPGRLLRPSPVRAGMAATRSGHAGRLSEGGEAYPAMAVRTCRSGEVIAASPDRGPKARA